MTSVATPSRRAGQQQRRPAAPAPAAAVPSPAKRGWSSRSAGHRFRETLQFPPSGMVHSATRLARVRGTFHLDRIKTLFAPHATERIEAPKVFAERE